MWWLVGQSVRRAPRRLLLAALAVAFPVAILSATLLYVDDSLAAMTNRALDTTQVEMRGLATSLAVDMADVKRKLAAVPQVRHVDLFAAADVLVGVPGGSEPVTARLVAVDPAYLAHHGWVATSGSAGQGVLLNGAVADLPGVAAATTLSIELPGDAAPTGLVLPITGRVDVRQATSWFEIPAGDVQGDVVATPRAILIDYATFQRDLLPALQRGYAGPAAAANPGLAELPPASLEAHVSIAHDSFPSDPAQAASWSAAVRRDLERQAPGDVIVADNTFEPLTEAASDATNAKVMFFLLGIPGGLVGAALGLAAASALTEANRREDALLRVRGAAGGQVARLAVQHGVLAGVLGTALGLALGALGTSAVVGHAGWRGIPPGRLVVIALLATAAGAIALAARLVPLARGRSQLTAARRYLTGPWAPLWLRARLDIVAVAAGLLILAGSILTGGLRPPLVDLHQQARTLSVSFFVLLAPVALWVGTSLLTVRVLLGLLSRWTRPDRPRPLTSWQATAVRWLGRRPARTATALLLGILAVAFGTEVVAFTSTYDSAKRAEAASAYGADLRLVPTTDGPVQLPDLGPDVSSVTPIRFLPARAGSDRKSITAVDPDSYAATVTAPAQIVQGGGVEALSGNPLAALVAEEVVADYSVTIGDILPVTVFPDDLDQSRQLDLVVVGVIRSFPPTDPFAEIVISAAAIPATPDVYLARVAPGRDPADVATAISDRTGGDFTVGTLDELVRKEQRSLTTLSLGGLGRIEIVAAATVAALGVGVLGAFVVLERRREVAILRSVGAGTRQVLTAPVLEGAVAAVGSLILGVPIGLGLASLAVRVLDVFFTLPPPLIAVPVGRLLLLGGLVVLGSAVALVIPLRRSARAEVSAVLREV